jgi:ABC-type transport system substrate-binding protein
MQGYFGSDNIPCDDNSGQGYNYARWIDDEADAAFAIAGSSPDLKVRADAYVKAAERIAEGRPHIYLYDRGDIDLLVEDFMGYNMNIWESVSWNADEWWIKK